MCVLDAYGQVLSGDELIRRSLDRRCLICNDGPLALDIDTGFPKQLCDACEKSRRAARPRAGESAAAYTRRHQAEGLANLDRLGGK